jgi:hypothetical protein
MLRALAAEWPISGSADERVCAGDPPRTFLYYIYSLTHSLVVSYLYAAVMGAEKQNTTWSLQRDGGPALPVMWQLHNGNQIVSL